MNDFTFIVLTYNHANYILEHLESIKYLVVNYARNIAIDLIIADDASRDDSVTLANTWCKKNSELFRKIVILSDGTNRGTCKNFTRALKHLTTSYCKITAGDDVYSYEDLFIESKKIDNKHIITGLPLNLINGTILDAGFDLFNLFATNLIYKKSTHLNRIKKVNFFNSPNIIYSVSALKNKDVTNFIDHYSVTEDYPLQIKMAELYAPLKYEQVDKIFVYYRRTNNSTYLIKNTEFSKDKMEIFKYLINSEQRIFSRFLLKNRLYCFKLSNKYFRRILNINLYLYGFGILRHLVGILIKTNNFDSKLSKHQNHYDLIAFNAKEFRAQ